MKKCKIVCISKAIAIFLSIITCSIHLTTEKILSSRSGYETFDDDHNIIGLRPPIAKYYVKNDNYSDSDNTKNIKYMSTDNTDNIQDHGHGDINIFNMMSQDEIKGLLDQIPMSTLKKLRSLTAIDPQLSHRFLWKMMKDKIELESQMKSHFLKPSFVDSLMTALWKEKIKKMMKTKEKVLRSIEKPRSLTATHSAAPPIVFENFEVFQIPSEVFFKNIQGNQNQNPKLKITPPSTTSTTTTTTQKPKINGGNTYIRFDHIVPAPPNPPQTFLTRANSATFPIVIKQVASESLSNPNPSAHSRRILESPQQQQQQQQQIHSNNIPLIQQWPTTEAKLHVDVQNENTNPSDSQAKWENWPPLLQQQAQPPPLIQPGIIHQQEQSQQQLPNTNSQIQTIQGVLKFQNSQQQIPASEIQQQQTIPNNNNNYYRVSFPQNSNGAFQSTGNLIPIPNSDFGSSHLHGSDIVTNNFGSFPYQPPETFQDPSNSQWNQHYYSQFPSQQNYVNNNNNNENTNYFSQSHSFTQQPLLYFPSNPSQFYYQNPYQYQYQHPNFDYTNNNAHYPTHYEQSQYSHEQNNENKDKDKHHHHGFFHESLNGLNHHHDEKEKEKGEKGADDYNNNNNRPNYAESVSASESNYDHYSKKASHVWDKAKEFFHHMNKKAHNANHKGITTKIFGMSISILAFVSFGLYIMMLLFQSAVLTLNFPLLSGIIGFISGDGGAGLVQFFLGRSLNTGSQIFDMDDLECKIKTAFDSAHQIFHLIEK